MDITTRKEFHDGNNIPILGYGTWQLTGDDAVQGVLWALKTGYRHIDTAQMYGNEERVGEGIRQSGIDRSDIFITTKLDNSSHDDPAGALDESLEKLGLEYVDLYLIHWPLETRLDAWKTFEKIRQSGKATSIGVSNFTQKHMDELLEQTSEKPVVNQVEFSPFLYQHELFEHCTSREIVIEGYSPLVRGRRLDDPTIKEVAETHGKTSAQVMLRWALQHGVVAIPKSGNQDRIKENADIFDFELNDEDVVRLDGLDEQHREVPDPHKYE